MQRHDELTNGQATNMAWPREPPQHEPSLGVERILMMDFASTLAHAKGLAPAASREEGRAEAAAARPPKALPLPTVDGVDKMYHQLAEIHAITAVKLAECAHWHQSNLTPNVAHASVGWQGPATVPSVTRAAPSPLTNVSPQASLQQRGTHAEPEVH
jgi:hypothetical protein